MKGWATLIGKLVKASLPRTSKTGERRMAHTKLIYEGPMRHKDGRERHVSATCAGCALTSDAFSTAASTTEMGR